MPRGRRLALCSGVDSRVECLLFTAANDDRGAPSSDRHCIIPAASCWRRTDSRDINCAPAPRQLVDRALAGETTNIHCAVARPGGKGGSFPLWVDVQKLCNMCVLSLSWNFFVSHDKYIVRPSSRGTLIHRQYNRDWRTSYSRPPTDPYLTSPLLQNPGDATDTAHIDGRGRQAVDERRNYITGDHDVQCTRLIPLPVGNFNFQFQFSKLMSDC